MIVNGVALKKRQKLMRNLRVFDSLLRASANIAIAIAMARISCDNSVLVSVCPSVTTGY